MLVVFIKDNNNNKEVLGLASTMREAERIKNTWINNNNKSLYARCTPNYSNSCKYTTTEEELADMLLHNRIKPCQHYKPAYIRIYRNGDYVYVKSMECVFKRHFIMYGNGNDYDIVDIFDEDDIVEFIICEDNEFDDK